ncbi:MAG: SIMPL domain-containing protein [Lysobacterales bacterium]
MKNAMKILLLAAMSMPGFAMAQANALPPSRHILVYGEAHARAIPDRFKIVVKFEVLDMNADRARAKVEAYVKDAVGKLRDSGVASGDIVATTLNIQPDEEYDSKLQKHVYLGTQVKREVAAIFDNQADLRKFLSQLETSEEVQVSGVDTELSTETELRAALRQKAIESTRQKAEVVAKAYGVRLVGLYSVSDTAPQFDYGINEGDWPAGYRWSDDKNSLDRIEVTGSRISPADLESFQTGYVTYDDKIYAVFLISE